MLVNVHFLTGFTVPVECGASSDIASVLQKASTAAGVRPCSVALYQRGVPLSGDGTVGDCGLRAGDVLHAVLRLRAGKGGFGSNLRSAGKKQKGIVTNFDACRDLSGRRIRHVTQEKQLEGWTEGQLADLRKSAHELSKKELSALERRERELAAEKAAQQKKPSAAELRQRAMEDTMAAVAQKGALLRQGAQEALEAALAKKRPAEGPGDSSSSDAEDETRPCSASKGPAPKKPKTIALSATLALSSDSDSD
nr:Replication stress response regulator SDE2 [Euglena gracilis]